MKICMIESRRFYLYAAVVIIFFSILSYCGGLNGDFVFDDLDLIKNDSFYTTVTNPLKCWTRSFWKASKTQGLYRPVTVFTYWLDTRIFAHFAADASAGWAPGFRIVNLFIHIIVSVLLFRVGLLLGFGRISSFAAALLFAVHPLHTEAVTPAFGRGELLCTLFLLAGLLFHLKSRGRLAFSATAALFFMLSFMAKEHGAVFIVVCGVIDLFLFFPADRELPVKTQISDFLRPRIKQYSIYCAALFCVFILRHHFLGSWLPAQNYFDPFIDNNIALSPWYIRIISAVKIQGMALFKLIFPITLSCDYSYSQILPVSSVFNPAALITLLLFAGTALFSAVKFPRFRFHIYMLFLLYIISILPAGNFIVISGTVFAERLSYLPSVWFALYAGFIIPRIARFVPGGALPLLFLIVFAFSARTVIRTFDWKSNYSLWKSALKTSPESIKVLNNYAVNVAEPDGDLTSAIGAYTKAVKILPRYSTAYANRGVCFARLGMEKEAEKDFLTALKYNKYQKTAGYNLGVIYARRGDIPRARGLWLYFHNRYPEDKLINNALKKSATP